MATLDANWTEKLERPAADAVSSKPQEQEQSSPELREIVEKAAEWARRQKDLEE